MHFLFSPFAEFFFAYCLYRWGFVLTPFCHFIISLDLTVILAGPCFLFICALFCFPRLRIIRVTSLSFFFRALCVPSGLRAGYYFARCFLALFCSPRVSVTLSFARLVPRTEQLVSVARASNHGKASFYNLAVTSLRQGLAVPNGQFKAYFLALLAGKEYTSVLESLSKVDKSFARTDGVVPRRRSFPYARPSSAPRTTSRVVCFYCGIPGHRVAQCYRKQRELDSTKPSRSQGSKSTSDYRSKQS